MDLREKIVLPVIAASVMGVLAAGGADVPLPDVKIAQFKGDRPAAISYTFDDGTLGHYKVAAPLLEKYGFRGTFFVVPGRTLVEPAAEATFVDAKGNTHSRPVSWKEWRELAARGHEVANHGLDHKKLPDLSDEEVVKQVQEAQRLIAVKVGVSPITFCYPGNGRNERVRKIVLQTHIAAREKEGGFGGANFTAALANRVVDKAIESGGQKVIMIHAVAEPGHQPISAEMLDAHLKYVAGLRDKIWVDTFANVSRYVRERETAQIEILERSVNQVSFRLTCPLDSKLFNGALTCVLTIGKPVATPSAQYNTSGVAVPVDVVKDKLLVNVVPGTDTITIRWKRENNNDSR